MIAEREQSVPTAETPARWRWKRWAIAGAVVCGLAGWWFWPKKAEPLLVQEYKAATQDIVESLKMSGAIEPLYERPIVAEVSGLVTALRVQASDHVRKGQVVAELQDADLLRQLDEARDALRQLEQGELVDARFKLREAQSVGVPAARNAAAQARLSQAEADGELQMKQMLFDAKAESRINLDSAKARREKARLEVAKADNEVTSATLKVVQAQGVLGLAQAKLTAARDKVVSLQRKVARLVVAAPDTGLVSRLKVQVGQAVTAGMPLYDLADDSKQMVSVEVNEMDAVKIKPDQLVKVTSMALPDLAMTGRISLITPVAEKLNRRSDFNSIVIKAVLDKVEGRLKSGSTVKAEIVLQERPKVTALPIEAVSADGDKKFVYVIGADSRAERKPVKTGIASVQHVEVVSGVKPGEAVVASLGKPIKEGDLVKVDDSDKDDKAGKSAGMRRRGKRSGLL